MADLEDNIVTRSEGLAALYKQPMEQIATKDLDYVNAAGRACIAASPFLVLATGNRQGLDCSPKGDRPGFVEVADNGRTLFIPDRRGNNRLDTLRNIVRNPPIGLLFLVPGVHETFRVNGEAFISRDPVLTEPFSVQGKAPRSVILVKVKEAYVQCSRALVRADIWNPAKHVLPGRVPSMGTMLAAHTRGFVNAEAFDEEAKARVPATLY